MNKITWVLDPAHSSVGFIVKHMTISKVKGFFKEFEVDITSDNDKFENTSVYFKAIIASLITGNDERDKHLLSADFFDLNNHPYIEFQSTSFNREIEGQYHMEGNLTILGKTKPITFYVFFGGFATDGEGLTRVGFEVEGYLSRKEFGMTWGTLTEAGGLVVSDEVKLVSTVELIKKV